MQSFTKKNQLPESSTIKFRLIWLNYNSVVIYETVIRKVVINDVYTSRRNIFQIYSMYF